MPSYVHHSKDDLHDTLCNWKFILQIEYKYHIKKIYANNANIYINIIPAIGLHVK